MMYDDVLEPTEVVEETPIEATEETTEETPDLTPEEETAE